MARPVWDNRELLNMLGSLDRRADRALTAVSEYHAPRAVSYARINARWTDRTSNARNGLFATAQHEPSKHRIVVGHTVSYGPWLEVRWSGRYAIIRPTIDHEGPEVMQTVSGLFGRMFQ